MPELPEAQTIAHELHQIITGKKITDIVFRREDIIHPNSEIYSSAYIGAEVHGVRRFGKKIIITTSSGDIAIQLGMTGKLLIDNQGARNTKHDHLLLTLEDGRVLIFNDVRRFGKIGFFRRVHYEVVDALEINSTHLKHSLSKTNKPIKAFLMDQKMLSGIGNIYADEICYRTKVHPLRPSKSLSKKEIELLNDSIHSILLSAIQYGGSSISDYVGLFGQKGNFTQKHKVYGRGGKMCYGCGEELQTIKISGRTTVFCAKEQK